MRAVLCGYYGFGNLGDELILESVVRQFRHVGVELVVLSRSPRETSNQHGVRSVNRWNPFSVMFALARSDLFVLGGGGLIQDQTSTWSARYYLGLACLAKVLGLRLVSLAIGIESLSNSFNRKIAGLLFRSMMDVITVRDQQSADLLMDWGVLENRIELVSDPVFGLPLFISDRKDGQAILMIPREPCPLTGYRFLELVDDRSCIGLMFPSIEKRRIPTGQHQVVELASLAEAQKAIRSAKVVLSARFHGLVLAILGGRPFVGIGESHKVGRLCSEWGQPYVPWNVSSGTLHAALSHAEKVGPNPKGVKLETLLDRGTAAVNFIWKNLVSHE